MNLILMKEIKPGEDITNLYIDIQKETELHKSFYYTTDLDTIKLIFKNKTIRSSSLKSAKLNDQMEKERVGIDVFAANHFITCFSHIDHEIEHFWNYYGGSNKIKKIMLKFKSFTTSFKDVINTDYCLLDNNKKIFFYSDEYSKTITHNCVLDQAKGMKKINIDFDITNCIRSIEMFDVVYVPYDDQVFTNDYSDVTNLNFYGNILKDIKAYDINSLGKYKSKEKWEIEQETRILSRLDPTQLSNLNYIDLRLKDEIFRDLVIIVSPWVDLEIQQDVQQQIQQIIESSSISNEIKSSISIIQSELKGTL